MDRDIAMARRFAECDIERTILDHRIGWTEGMGYLRALGKDEKGK
jgi:hypothetical protein